MKVDKYAPDEVFNKNLIISKNCAIPLLNKNSNINPHTLLIGSLSSEIKESFIEPNIRQCNSNYIIDDTTGYLYGKYKNYLKESGYDVIKIDKTNITSFNPFNYVFKKTYETDILAIANSILSNTYATLNENEQFFKLNCKALLTGALFYVYETMDKDKQNMLEVYNFLASLGDGITSFPDKDSNRQYVKYLMAAVNLSKKTLFSVVINTLLIINSFLYPFDTKIRNIDYNHFAMFVCTDSADSSLSPVFSAYISAFIKVLTTKQVLAPTHILLSDGAFAISNICDYLDYSSAKDGLIISAVIPSIDVLKQKYPRAMLCSFGQLLVMNESDEKTKNAISAYYKERKVTYIPPKEDEVSVFLYFKRPFVDKKYTVTAG